MKSNLVIAFLALILAAAPFASAQDGRAPALPNFDRRTPIVLAVENVGPAVVSIKTQFEVRQAGQRRRDPFLDMFQPPEPEPDEVVEGHAYRERSQGSGVIFHPYGYVITNYHVVAKSDRITLVLQNGGAGKTLEASLINADMDNDVAILKIKAPGTYPYALMGDSDRLLAGETTIALGNPFGLSASVTTGIISATNRSVTLRGEVVFKDFVQTSALINPGNSGGPLLDVNGYVIGINVAIDQRGPGIGYAIPINRVREVAANLLDPEMVRRSWLGLDVVSDRSGLRVDKVADNGPAARLNLQKGDQIVAVGPKKVDDRLGLNIELLQFQPGATVPLTVRRDRDYQLQIPFEAVPADEVRAAEHRFDSVGMVVADLTPALAGAYGLDDKTTGVVITKVLPGSIAERTELAPGDVVVTLAGYRIKDTENLSLLMRALLNRRYDKAEILVFRKGQHLKGPLPLK